MAELARHHEGPEHQGISAQSVKGGPVDADELPPISLYVHIPWCVRKCPYCDFNSHPIPRGARKLETALGKDYVDALMRDLESQLPYLSGRRLSSVFIGGGTPSLVESTQIGRIIRALGDVDALSADAEITLEANPGQIEHSAFAEYVGVGVTRLSLGVQSLDDECLRRLGRIHGGGEAHRAMASALEAGFASVNVDLMFGLPGQDRAGALADVKGVLSHEPWHVSYYQLTLEPGTYFYRHPPKLPGDDLTDEIYLVGRDALAEAGLLPYEVSAYARSGHQSRHNLNYWEYGDYVGIGAGAHGKITLPEGHSMIRTENERIPARYQAAMLESGAARAVSAVGTDTIRFEFMLNALRIEEGFAMALFEARTGIASSELDQSRAQALASGLIEDLPDQIVPTERGRRFLNDLILMMAPDVGS